MSAPFKPISPVGRPVNREAYRHAADETALIEPLPAPAESLAARHNLAT
jgi:hypothetical protein